MKTLFIPNPISHILQRLEHAGFQAWLVGGCVRDGLMGLSPNDWDICTDALPDQVSSLFPDSLNYGIQHGTVTVRSDGMSAEVTTFRTEGLYSDHRRPDQVTFVKNLDQDLARRDFTVNAIAMNVRGELQDPFSGMADLQAGILRAVGKAESRFQEDALRMLRAIRFSAQLGFSLEPETLHAIKSCAGLVSQLAAERVCTELEKTILTDRPEHAEMMCSLGLLAPWGILRHTHSLIAMRNILKTRLERWMAYSLTLPDLSPLAALRLDRKTILACEALRTIAADPSEGNLKWKKAISQYDYELAGHCASVLGKKESETMEAILQRGDCCCLRELAVSGADALEAGLQGSEIRFALDNALRHVWAHPEDNTPDKLMHYLRKEAEFCE